MKMAKASEQDIEAAGNAMSVLSDVSSGYYPQREGDDCDDMFFDPENPHHLRRFFELINATLQKSPGWPGRVIGGMCYVILFKKNQIVDPDADVLDLHPRFTQIESERNDLLEALQSLLDMDVSYGRGHKVQEAVDAAHAAIAKAEGRS